MISGTHTTTINSDDEIEQRKIDLKKRLLKLRGIYGTRQKTEIGGSLGKAIHQAGLTAEGVAFEMLFIMLFNAIEFLGNVPYRIQENEYASAQEAGIAYEGTDEQLIYPLDEEGNVDLTQTPFEAHEAPRAVIRANGYVPPPSHSEANQTQWDSYTADMMGDAYLTDASYERLYKTCERNKPNNSHSDLNSEVLMQQNLRGRPTLGKRQ